MDNKFKNTEKLYRAVYSLEVAICDFAGRVLYD